MTQPLRLMVAGCSALSTGELTIVLDWARRCERLIDLRLLVPEPVAPQVRWAGTVVTYTPRGGMDSVRQMIAAFDDSRPDLLVLADLLLFHSAPAELGAPLDAFLRHAVSRGRVAALDLYDWDRRSALLECYGQRRFAESPGLPPRVARLLPSPYLPPASSSPGRGRYAMMEDGSPLADDEKTAVRRELGVDGSRLVLVLTSPWQHVAQFLAGARGVATHFPALMLRLLDLAAERVGDTTLVHVGPAAINVPDDVRRLRYRHVAQMPPSQFRRLLGAADLLLSPNCIASSILRAASMRVPSVALWMSADAADGPVRVGPTPAQGALALYLQRARPAYGFLVWPLGMRAALGDILENNPYRDVQAYLDVLQPDAAVEGIERALADARFADAIRDGQQRYFSALQAMDSPEEALGRVLAPDE